MNDERLFRMETKLDKLSEAVVAMARMEERMITVFKRLDMIDIADWFEEIEAEDVQHMGSYNCRKIANTDIWSQHSFGTALDIASINGASLKKDWFTDSTKSEYLREAAFVACDYFANVLTPDYNAAHHDHFHLDHGPRYSSCDPEWYTFLRLQYRKLKTLF